MMTKRYFGFVDDERIGQLKINFILILILWISLLLFACINQPQTQNTGTNIANKTVPASNLTNTTNASKPCYALSNPDKDNCYFAEGRNGNVSSCLSIVDVDLKDKCILPFSSNNVTLCESLSNSSLRDSCYLSNAKGLNNSSYCQKIENDSVQKQCMSWLVSQAVVLTLDQFCASASDLNNCYIDYAVQHQNITVCNKISKDSIKTACIGVLTNSTGICNNVEFAVASSLCYTTEALETDNYLLCGMENDTGYKNDCYEKLAIKDKDPDHCTLTAPESYRDYCYTQVAYATLDGTICGRVITPSLKAGCYISTAKLASDPGICNPIDNLNLRETCYSGVLTFGQNLSSTGCNNISSDTWHDNCYDELAQRNNQSSYCLPIFDQLVRNRCLSRFG